jgi:Ca-activated chloride channel family protein
MLAWCLAASAMIVALARPQWGELPAEESVRTRDLVVALDVSDSMRCPDLTPSRLQRALTTIERALPLLEGNRLAVVVFAGDAYPLIPLTIDLDAAAVFLEGVEPGMVALPGSNIERAVNASLELLPAEGDGRVVVLVTDGENLQGDTKAAADALSEASVGVLAVVAGTEGGGPIPVTEADGSVRYKRDRNGQQVVTRAHPEVLAELADAVGGDVVSLEGRDAHHRLAAAVDELRTREAEVQRVVQRVERFPLFLVLASVLLIVGFLLSPWRRTTAVLAMVATAVCVVTPIHAQQTSAAAAPRAPGGASAPGDEATPQKPATLPEPAVSWWQRWLPGGSRRLAREGVSRWGSGDIEGSGKAFAGAAELDPESPERAYDLGTAVAAAGDVEPATPLLERAFKAGIDDAAFNAGTAALAAQQPGPAVGWLRKALLADPTDPDVKRNFELALQMLEQQQQDDQKKDDQKKDDQKKDDQKKDDQQDQSGQQQPTGTPTPQPQGGQAGPTPTPTPQPNQGLFEAIERAEANARDDMKTPTPQTATVEKDW